jgi:hypothetical protein
MAIWAEVMNTCVGVAVERPSPFLFLKKCLDMHVTSHNAPLAAGNDSSRLVWECGGPTCVMWCYSLVRIRPVTRKTDAGSIIWKIN